MTIAKFLDINVAYITQEDGDNLADLENLDVEGLIVREHEYGWWIHVPLDDGYSVLIRNLKPTFSPAFIEVMAFAHTNGCWWINIDTDGEQEATLTRVRDEVSPTVVFNDLNPGQRARLFELLEKHATKRTATPSDFAMDDGRLRKLWRAADSHVRAEFQRIAGCKPVSE